MTSPLKQLQLTAISEALKNTPEPQQTPEDPLKIKKKVPSLFPEQPLTANNTVTPSRLFATPDGT